MFKRATVLPVLLIHLFGAAQAAASALTEEDLLPPAAAFRLVEATQESFSAGQCDEAGLFKKVVSITASADEGIDYLLGPAVKMMSLEEAECLLRSIETQQVEPAASR